MRYAKLAPAFITLSICILATSWAADGEQPSTSECRGEPWAAGQRAFAEVTDAWGLTGVTGITFVVVDIDNDQWPDLLVRNYGAPHKGAKSEWILRNTGAGSFEDITSATGLSVAIPESDGDTDHGPGSLFAAGDVNNDGHVDLYLGNRRCLPEEADSPMSDIMLSNGDGTFSPGPPDNPVRFADRSFTPTGASFLDYDRDGNLDLWIGQHTDESGYYPPGQDRLFRGDGTGMFRDVTEELGLTTEPWHVSIENMNNGLAHSWAWGVTTCDLNNDGIPELLTASYGRAPNHLWRGAVNEEGQVYYVNESVASGYAYDDNMDWTQDLSAQCYCQLNPDAEGCDKCPEPWDPEFCERYEGGFRWYDHFECRQPFTLGGNSGTTVCADINNDGFMDLLTTEIVHGDVGAVSDHSEILVNTGDMNVRFERPGIEETGLTRELIGQYWNHGDMTAAVFDFDNDGWQDIFIGASDYAGNWGLLYHQAAPLQFELLGTADYFLHYRAMGQAVADFDRDGDLDLIVGHHRIRCTGEGADEVGEIGQIRMYENCTGAGLNWLQLYLKGGDSTNRMAIGARVEVTAGGITQTQYVDGGHGKYVMQRNAVLHFGLAESDEAQVSITWPDAARTTQSFALPANCRYLVIQGQTPESLALQLE